MQRSESKKCLTCGKPKEHDSHSIYYGPGRCDSHRFNGELTHEERVEKILKEHTRLLKAILDLMQPKPYIHLGPG